MLTCRGPLLLIFDLDGTVIDSKKDIANAVIRTFGEFGIPEVSPEMIERHIGVGVGPLIRQRAAEAWIQDIESVMTKFNQNYLDHLIVHTEFFDGMPHVLETLSAFPKAILTNKSNLFLRPLVKALNLDRYFVSFYGRESFVNCKPDPLPLVEIAKMNHIPLSHVLMIGDTETDIMAGKNAGSLTCAVTYGYGERAVLSALEPTFLIDHPLSLIDLIKRIENE